MISAYRLAAVLVLFMALAVALTQIDGRTASADSPDKTVAIQASEFEEFGSWKCNNSSWPVYHECFFVTEDGYVGYRDCYSNYVVCDLKSYECLHLNYCRP